MRGLCVVDRYSFVSVVIWARSTAPCCSFTVVFSRTQDPYWRKQLLKMQASKDSMSKLESSMATIIEVFHKYSVQNCTLRKTDLKALINNEMSHFIRKIKDNEILDKLFTDLDENGDLEIDFKEFVALIAMVTAACHEIFTPTHNH